MQVVDRRACALAREAVERPEDDDLELPLVRVLEERLESSAAPGGTRFLISIFLDQLPALVTIDEGAKLPSLVLGFLPVGGDSRIEGDPSHGSQGTPFGSVSRGAEEPMKPGLRARHPADPFEPPSRQWYRTPDHYPLACVFVPLFPNPQIGQLKAHLPRHGLLPHT